MFLERTFHQRPEADLVDAGHCLLLVVWYSHGMLATASANAQQLLGSLGPGFPLLCLDG